MSSNYRSYGSYLSNAINAVHSGIDRANSINDPYYKEGSLIFISNAWELLAKAILIKHGGENNIYEKGTRKERTISAENAISKLTNLGYITDYQSAPIQQIISLRNEASHQSLPDIADEVLFHLEYYSVRYFKEILEANFKQYANKMRNQFLSVSFNKVSTYADGVKKLVSRARKNKKTDDIRLAYLLERGIVFSGSEYIKQSDFQKVLLSKQLSRPMYKLKLGEYARKADMVVVVPIQAPNGTKADIKLSKTRTNSISVNIDKRATDDDYPYLTKDLSSRLGKSSNFISKATTNLGLRNNPLYHQKVRASSKSYIQKYSDQCLNYLRDYINKYPEYNPNGVIK